MLVTDELSDLQFRQGKSLIVVPEFIGVYQGEERLFESKEARQQQFFNKFSPLIKQFSDFVSNHALKQLTGREDPIHSELIHIFYDSANWNENLVRICLGDYLGRVAISDIKQEVDFSEKDVISSLGLLFENLLDGNSVEKYLKENQGKIEQIRLDSSKYGLRREEYAALQALRQGYSGNPNSKNSEIVLGALKQMVEKRQERD